MDKLRSNTSLYTLTVLSNHKRWDNIQENRVTRATKKKSNKIKIIHFI